MDSNFAFLIVGLPERVQYLEEKGLFNDAIHLVNKILAENHRLSTLMKSRLEWETERIERMKKDYPLSHEEAFESLRNPIPDLNQDDFRSWMKNGLIECREIEGETKVFKNFLPNLLRDYEEVRERVKQPDTAPEKVTKLVNKHLDTIVEKGKTIESRYLEPVKNRILMKLKVEPHVIPEDEVVRVWMPIPRKDPLQPEVKIISATPETYVLAPEDSSQRTIHFETSSTEIEELEFRIQYEYIACASYQEVKLKEVHQHYSQTELYREHTAELLPHIAFTPYLRKLGREIVGEEQNPYLRAWLIYKWITERFSYALVPEYSTIECIGDYAARNLRGDCGVQALLFITLCRISGVPARWQSGWFLNPIRPSPHDWAQFYIEPYGWLHADISFGRHRKSEEKYHKFYFGNMDHFRLIANTEISSEFTPQKIHYRSDNVDNQRGEVEWREGNIYYDKWSYELKVLAHETIMN